MSSKRSILSAILCTLAVVNAAPALIELLERQSITTLTKAQISAFRSFTHFASTAYCSSNTTINWSCGASCAANSDFIPTASGGDGSDVQFWYVGFSPSQKTVIVAHQGTNTSETEALTTDLNVSMESLNSTLFPGVSSSVEAHSGFANEQSKTAAMIRSAVRSTIKAHSATTVTIVGQSLLVTPFLFQSGFRNIRLIPNYRDANIGAALALLDGIYLPLHITGVSFKVVSYGMPRVGNQAFANYVDAHLDLTHINKEDIVPIVPGSFMGFVHPSGEVHIMDNNKLVSCPGQDNPSTKCIVGDVPNIFDGKLSDHVGKFKNACS